MELTNDFRVAIPPATAWSVLTDVERIAPCMPGAQLQEVEGDEYRGVVKVKVGPITAQYKGAASFVERDDANLKAVLKAEGRDTRGQGNASATITATLTADGDGTRVNVVTDLHVTGKVAQFGRGVMADVSSKLLGQFVECLETTVLAAPTTEAQPATWEAPTAPVAANTPPEVSSTGPRKIDSPEAKPVNLIDTAGGSVAKRAAPVLAVIAVLWLLRLFLKRRKK
jgi:hypothetical protein